MPVPLFKFQLTLETSKFIAFTVECLNLNPNCFSLIIFIFPHSFTIILLVHISKTLLIFGSKLMPLKFFGSVLSFPFFFGIITIFASFHDFGKYALLIILLNNVKYSEINDAHMQCSAAFTNRPLLPIMTYAGGQFGTKKKMQKNVKKLQVNPIKNLNTGKFSTNRLHNNFNQTLLNITLFDELLLR